MNYINFKDESSESLYLQYLNHLRDSCNIIHATHDLYGKAPESLTASESIKKNTSSSGDSSLSLVKSETEDQVSNIPRNGTERINVKCNSGEATLTRSRQFKAQNPETDCWNLRQGLVL